MPLPESNLSPLLILLNQMQPLTEPLQEALNEKFERIHVKQDRMLVTQGTVCEHMWFLAEGISCSWVNLPGEEDETVTRLMAPGHIVVTALSFYGNVPSVENIPVLNDATLFRIQRDDLDNIYKNFPEFNYNTRKLTEQYACQITRRELLLRHRNVEERIKFFMLHFGHLKERIPEKYAASFACMSRRTYNSLKNGNYTKKWGGKNL